MRRLLIAVGMAMLIVGCTTPLRIQMTDASGAAHEIDVKNPDGTVVEVGNDLKKKIDTLKPAMEKEIKRALEEKAKRGDFQKEYAIPVDAVVSNGSMEPLNEEEKAVFRAISDALAREHAKQIIYPEWAKKAVGDTLPSATAKLAEGDYAEAREIIWGIKKTGISDVDELTRKLGNRFLNKDVNPVQWLLLEKDVTAKGHDAIMVKDYAKARKVIDDLAEIRTFPKSLTQAPTPSTDETEDSLKVIDGKTSGSLGTIAMNVRIAKLKEKLLSEVAAAEKADLDAKMQSTLDTLTAKMTSLVTAENFDAARNAIYEVASKSKGDAERSAKIKATCINLMNSVVNPAQWISLEKVVTAKITELIDAKDYAGARKLLEGLRDVRKYPNAEQDKTTAQEDEDKVDTMTVVGGKVSGALGTYALNVRIAKLREKLLADIASAEKAELDAKMQKLVDELTAKVISLVESDKFTEARNAIRDVSLVDNDEWDAKIYAVRIGLMNSVINPNQFKYLKDEATKTIDDLVSKGKYDDVIKFIDNYPYVHDIFAQIMESFDRIEKAMKTLKLEDNQSAEYVASRLASVRELMEKRLGKYNGSEDYSELEKALSELEEGYIGQHYDNTAATGVTNTIKGEIVAMVDAKYAPLTTWEMNKALRRFLESKRPKAVAVTNKATGTQMAEESAPTLGVISEEVDYDAQIAMAEAAIAEPAACYGLEAVLGDYARIMRRCKA